MAKCEKNKGWEGRGDRGEEREDLLRTNLKKLPASGNNPPHPILSIILPFCLDLDATRERFNL